MILLAISIVILIVVLGLFREGYFVLDRNVFDFQITPVLKSGEIKNINQYRIVHNCVEMMFEKDPDTFESNHKVQQLNSMLVKYHESNL